MDLEIYQENEEQETLETQELDNDVRLEISGNLSSAYSFWSDQVEASKEDLTFADGDQWSQDAQMARTNADENQPSRPMLVTHAIRPYLNRVINPLRMYPFGIQVSPKRLSKEMDPEGLVSKASKYIKGYVRRVESRSRAVEAYENAFASAVTCGMGFITIGLDYLNPEAMDRQVTINSVDDIGYVILDPHATAVDGSDAEWGAIVTPISKLAAKRMVEDPDFSTPDGMPSLFIGWEETIPEDTVWDMVYYRKSRKSATRYRLDDGNDAWEIPEGRTAVKQRNTTRETVECYHFIGDQFIEKVDLETRWIPIVPVYGDRVHLENRRWAGLIHWGRDLVQLTNYYLSQETELVGQAPRSVWLVSEGQKEGHPEWDESNVTPRTSLTYRAENYANGQGVPIPSRVDTTANTGPLIASRQAVLQDLARTLGISDNMMGRMEVGAESGVAVNARTSTGELATAHYSQNLAMSVAQVGRIVVDLVRGEEKGVRWVEVQNERGEVEEVQLDIGAMFEAIGGVDVDAEAGPSYANARKEAVQTLLALGQVMQDKMPVMADIIANNSDVPGSEILAKRFEKMLPPELRDEQEEGGGIDPQAKQALDAADATINQQQQAIDELKGLVMQFQAKFLDDSKDRQTDILKTIIDSRTKLALEQMKQAGQDGRLAAQISADAEKDIMDQVKGMGIAVDDLVLRQMVKMPPPAPGPLSYEAPEVENALNQIEMATSQLGDAPVPGENPQP